MQSSGRKVTPLNNNVLVMEVPSAANPGDSMLSHSFRVSGAFSGESMSVMGAMKKHTYMITDIHHDVTS